jgi:hypothetical protein
MISCLLEGMKNNAHIQVNYDKIREVTQGPEENLALFLVYLMDTITKYTNLDLNSPAGTLFLHVQFICQSAQNIQKKLKQLEQGPKTPQQELLDAAFRVFNNRDEHKKEQEKHLKVKYQLLALTLQPHVCPQKNSLKPYPCPSLHWHSSQKLLPVKQPRTLGQESLPKPQTFLQAVLFLWPMGTLEN